MSVAIVAVLLPTRAGLHMRDHPIAIYIASLVVKVAIDPCWLVVMVVLTVHINWSILISCAKCVLTLGKFSGLLHKPMGIKSVNEVNMHLPIRIWQWGLFWTIVVH